MMTNSSNRQGRTRPMSAAPSSSQNANRRSGTGAARPSSAHGFQTSERAGGNSNINSGRAAGQISTHGSHAGKLTMQGSASSALRSSAAQHSRPQSALGHGNAAGRILNGSRARPSSAMGRLGSQPHIRGSREVDADSTDEAWEEGAKWGRQSSMASSGSVADWADSILDAQGIDGDGANTLEEILDPQTGIDLLAEWDDDFLKEENKREQLRKRLQRLPMSSDVVNKTVGTEKQWATIVNKPNSRPRAPLTTKYRNMAGRKVELPTQQALRGDMSNITAEDIEILRYHWFERVPSMELSSMSQEQFVDFIGDVVSIPAPTASLLFRRLDTEFSKQLSWDQFVMSLLKHMDESLLEQHAYRVTHTSANPSFSHSADQIGAIACCSRQSIIATLGRVRRCLMLWDATHFHHVATVRVATQHEVAPGATNAVSNKTQNGNQMSSSAGSSGSGDTVESRALAYMSSRDGKLFVCCGSENILHIVNVRKRCQDGHVSIASSPCSMTISSSFSGTVFASHQQLVIVGCTDGSVTLINPRTNSLVKSFNASHSFSPIVSAFFWPDIGFVCASADGHIAFVEILRWSIRRSFKAHNAGITHMTFDTRTRSIFTGSADRTVKKWDPFQNQPVDTLCTHGGSVISLFALQNRRMLVSVGANKVLLVHSLDNLKQLSRNVDSVKHHPVDRLCSAGWNAVSNSILTCGCMVRSWPVLAREKVLRKQAVDTGKVSGADMPPEKLAEAVGIGQAVVAVLYSRHLGMIIIVGDSICEVLEAKSGQKVQQFSLGKHGPVTSAILDEAGTRLITGKHRGQVEMWEFSVGEYLGIIDTITKEVASLTILSDRTGMAHRPVIAGGWDKNVTMMSKTVRASLAVKSAALTGHQHDVTVVQACDMLVLSVDSCGNAKVWYGANGHQRAGFLVGENRPAALCSVWTGRSTTAFVGLSDGKIAAIRPAIGKVERSFVAFEPESDIICVCICLQIDNSTNTGYVAVGGSNGSIVLFKYDVPDAFSGVGTLAKAVGVMRRKVTKVSTSSTGQDEAGPGSVSSEVAPCPLIHEIARNKAHSRATTALEWGGASGFLISGGEDGGLRIWDNRLNPLFNIGGHGKWPEFRLHAVADVEVAASQGISQDSKVSTSLVSEQKQNQAVLELPDKGRTPATKGLANNFSSSARQTSRESRLEQARLEWARQFPSRGVKSVAAGPLPLRSGKNVVEVVPLRLKGDSERENANKTFEELNPPFVPCVASGKERPQDPNDNFEYAKDVKLQVASEVEQLDISQMQAELNPAEVWLENEWHKKNISSVGRMLSRVQTAMEFREDKEELKKLHASKQILKGLRSGPPYPMCELYVDDLLPHHASELVQTNIMIDLIKTLNENRSVIKEVFRAYAASGANDLPDFFTVGIQEFRRLGKDCRCSRPVLSKLDSVFRRVTRHERGRKAGSRQFILSEFVEGVVRLSNAQYSGTGPISDKVGHFIKKHMLLYPLRHRPDDYHTAMLQPEMQSVLRRHSKLISNLYNTFCKFSHPAEHEQSIQDGSPAPDEGNIQGFVEILKRAGLMDSSLSVHKVAHMFVQCNFEDDGPEVGWQEWDWGMTIGEFKQGLVRIADSKVTSHETVLHMKSDAFLKSNPFKDMQKKVAIEEQAAFKAAAKAKERLNSAKSDTK